MPGNYTITIRNNGDAIDQIKYMADHQQHVDNLEPPKIDDYSVSVAQMRTVTDPGEVGTESVPTSLAGEIERIRFVLKELKGTAQWYESVASSFVQVWQPGDTKATFRSEGTPPPGWLFCDGSAVSRVTYAALFAAIGVVHGIGDGSTTFNLPTCSGRVLVGAGLGAGLTISWGIGSKFGAENHVLSPTEMPAHAHNLADPGHGHHLQNLQGTSTPGSGAQLLAGSGPVADLFVEPAITGIAVLAAGGNGAHNNMQPGIGVRMLIKT